MEDKAIEILKRAILLEKKGKAFYEKVSKDSKNESVKKFFEMMSEEEEKHIQALSLNLKSYSKSKTFVKIDLNDKANDSSASVLTKAMMNEVKAAEYEAAAISAAMGFEEKAQKFYADRASKSSDENEKQLYNWLSKWESNHLNFLVEVDTALTEKVWYDQHFWPLD